MLTRREYALLHLLAQNTGRILTHEYIMERLWPNTEVNKSSLHTLVGRLRAKIGARHVETRLGIGYFGVDITLSGE